ncbi:hypothetical protein R5R35_003956 [Gryllus longicercus]|uniref:Hyaluronan/mRNA-binding protein domain-containing protein n=1 Tax=Gryllus longicercus TaxID=2509291 RepID=A0AAN9V9B3_9ORTH|nr:Uncharacterized protein GBIM_00938 [Gryllus bimaculatus]
MENSYGIGVANRYALFLDEAEDPLEVLKVQEQEREAKKKTKLSEKENKGKPETKGKTAPGARKGIKETQNVKTLDSGKTREENNRSKSTPRPAVERTERNVKFAGESREERNNRRNREDKPFLAGGDFVREPRENRPDGEFRGRGRGGSGIGGGGRGLGRGRGMRGAGRGGYDNRGKREFDRQSGSDKTGVKPVDKRDGAGAHNWGTHRDDIEEQLNSPRLTDDQAEWGEKVENEVPHPAETTEVKESDGTEDENAQPVEEEPRELTLDEYYAMRRGRQKPTYNIRKAGEGEDLTQWKKMYELKKKDGEEEEEEEEEYDASEYPQRVGRQKHLLDIDIHFADSRRGSRGRGRGGLRGTGRGRGTGAPPGMSRGPGENRIPLPSRGFSERPEREPFQRNPRQSAPKVDDEHDFPSLG